MLNYQKRLVIIFVIAFCVNGCVAAKSGNLMRQDFLSTNDINEIKLGNDIHHDIIRNFSVYDNQQVNGYIKQLGNNLALQTFRKLPYHFTVLHDDRVYSVAAPGGYIYLTSGMLCFLDNEAELAYVLSHELARMQYLNPKYSDAKDFFSSISEGGLIAGSMLFPPYGMVAGVLVKMISQTYSKEKALDVQTLDADKLAMQYMVKAGYDPQGLFDFLYKILELKSEERKKMIYYLSSHPLTINRFNDVSNYFDSLSFDNAQLNVYRDRFMLNLRPLFNSNQV